MKLTEIIKAADTQQDILTPKEGWRDTTVEQLREAVTINLYLTKQLALHLQHHTKVEHGKGVITCTPLNPTSEGDDSGRTPGTSPEDS